MQEHRTPAAVPFGTSLGFASSSVSLVTDQIEATCHMIAAGRIAASQLAMHAKSCALTEAEFRLLWLLRTNDHQQPTNQSQSLPNQKALGEQLGLSPAQVSAVVERLRKEGLVTGQASPTDRRRNVWQLTSNGNTLLQSSIEKLSSSTNVLPIRSPFLQKETDREDVA